MKVEAKDLQLGDMRSRGGRVESISSCRSAIPGAKIHINDEDCYDARQLVDITKR